MTDRKNRKQPAVFKTLRMKAVAIAVAALVTATVVSSLFNWLGGEAVNKFLLNDEKLEEEHIELLLSFADFVKENNLSSTDTDRFDEWRAENGNAALTVFKESEIALQGEVSYTTDSDGYTTIVNQSELPFYLRGTSIITNGATSTDSAVYSDIEFMVYPVRFTDGICSVTIFNHTKDNYNTAVSVIALIIFWLILIVFIWKYIDVILRKIKSLSKQVAVVSKGNISASVEMEGADELSSLAADVEHMRAVLEKQIISEKNAWQSNQELLTSISHDIRTPLTTLIAYSDMLSNGQYNGEEQLRRYLKSCRDKAYQLKSLTDELFGYFLVFGSPEVKVNNEIENARILLEQLIGEPLIDLKVSGCDVKEAPLEEDVFISVDVMLFKRIFDNIFSNINKYADLKHRVSASAKNNGETIVITFENAINPDASHRESTKIGTKICERLCKAMDIGYEVENDGKKYKTVLTVPVVEN